METILRLLKKIIPRKLFLFLAPMYHYTLALLGALLYRFPSKSLIVIGVTGTKGKTTTVELINTILEEAGKRTALGGTYRFKIGNENKRNLYKMTMPGRFQVQRFLRNAVKMGCSHVVLEMTSQGVLQSRHRFIDPDALVFTNISPEHIESHGSFEQYLEAKLELAHLLERSSKKNPAIIANSADPNGKRFLSVNVSRKYPFSKNELEHLTVDRNGISFTYKGISFHSSMRGEFNALNMLAAIKTAEAFGVSLGDAKRALEKFSGVRGRVEEIIVSDNQPIRLFVDYAHTTDSLEKLYSAFPHEPKVCVLGNTGGGRDKWKRGEMAKIAERHCREIILTNEDPYDEDPEAIVQEMYDAIENKNKAEIIMDRRLAIRKAIEKTQSGDVILVSGKGTDPYIMIENGKKIPWDDATVAREELEKFLSIKKPEESNPSGN